VLRVTEGGGILSKQEFALDGDAKKPSLKKRSKLLILFVNSFFGDQTSNYENLGLNFTYKMKICKSK
jgi:hypothetical protein